MRQGSGKDFLQTIEYYVRSCYHFPISHMRVIRFSHYLWTSHACGDSAAAVATPSLQMASLR